MSDLDGYIFDGGTFAKIVLGGIGVATAAEAPYVSALCGLATVAVDASTQTAKVDLSSYASRTWAAAWSDSHSSWSRHGKPLEGPPGTWVEPSPSNYGDYQMTPLAYSEYNDHWMAFDTWGSDGYYGPEVHNYVKFAGFMLAGTFNITGSGSF